MPLHAAWFAGLGLSVTAAGAIVAVVLGPLPLQAWIAHPVASFMLAQGENPYPVRLVRPPVAPPSAMAQLGQLVFFDASLASSGQLACASCHSPEHAYGPPGDASVMNGGPLLSRQGVRAVPSLMYLERQPNFSIGPDNEENETVNLAQLAARACRSGKHCG
jgi:cytochrome c peroxidase